MLAVAWLVAAIGVTLTPGGGSTARIVSLCMLCGQRGTADALLNVILFVPLGLLVGSRHGTRAALLAGLACSTGIEIGQLLLAGRYSNLGDLVWNSLGAGLGGWAAPVLRRWLSPARPTAALVTAVGLPVAWLLSAAFLLRPIHGTQPHDVHHLDDAEGLRVYGDWSAAANRALDIRPEPRVAGGAHLDLESNGAWTLEGRAIREPDTYWLAPIAGVYDAGGRPLRVLGVDRGDIVLWELTPATLLRFDYPSHHLRGALADYEVGDTLVASASSPSRGEVCLAVGSSASCMPRITPERTWTLLRSRERASERLKKSVDVAWMATIALPMGLVAGTAGTAIALVATLLGAVALISWATVLSGLGAGGLVGICIGTVAGAALRPLTRTFLTGMEGR